VFFWSIVTAESIGFVLSKRILEVFNKRLYKTSFVPKRFEPQISLSLNFKQLKIEVKIWSDSFSPFGGAGPLCFLATNPTPPINAGAIEFNKQL